MKHRDEGTKILGRNLLSERCTFCGKAGEKNHLTFIDIHKAVHVLRAHREHHSRLALINQCRYVELGAARNDTGRLGEILKHV